MKANTADTTNTIPCINPATGETIGSSPIHTPEDLKQAIAQARGAQKEWARWPVKKRARALKPVLHYLVEQADTLAETISKDNGKPRVDAMATEVLPAAMALKYYMKHAGKFLKTRPIPCGNLLLVNKRSRLARVPFGVVGIISPWNYPFAIPFSEVVMALLAGNGVVLKTASDTQQVGLALKECFQAAPLPPGLFHFLNLSGREAGTGMLEKGTGVDKLFFTGSVPAGKWLMAKASETLTPHVLELGGNDPMLVCDDADLSRAAAGAVWAGLSNAGQSCGGVERVYVHEAVYEQFLAELKTKVENLRPGNGLDWDADLGVMTTKKQVELVKTHIEEAVEQGAQIFAQSPPPEDKARMLTYHPATVLTNVTHDMVVMKEETFGPVLGVMKVKDMEEALRLANDSDLGLTGSVWSRNRKKALSLGARIQAGAITVNDHLMSHGLAETPWGGFKESGIGRTHGRLGFDEMTRPQVLVNDILPFARRNMWWQPYSRKVYAGLKGLMEFLYSPSLSRRFGGLFRLLKIFPRYFSNK